MDNHTLAGHWRLISFLERRTTGEWFDALGPDPKGCISYWPNGQMQVLITSRQRPRFRGEWNSIPATDKAACLDQMVAYAGRFSIEGDRVIHHVDSCWIPNWEQRDLVRVVSFPQEGQVLLATVPDSGPRARPAQRVLWERTR